MPDGDLSRIRLTLAPAPSAAGAAVRLNMGGLPTATIEPNGQFKFTGVTPGRYRLTGNAPGAPGSPPGISWTMQSAVAKGRDVLDFPLDIGPSDETGEIVVTFTDAVQEVNGTPAGRLGPSGAGLHDHRVRSDSRFWTPLSRRVRIGAAGHRRQVHRGQPAARRIPDGRGGRVSPGEVTDPAFLEQLVAASIKITLADGERRRRT